MTAERPSKVIHLSTRDPEPQAIVFAATAIQEKTRLFARQSRDVNAGQLLCLAKNASPCFLEDALGDQRIVK